MKLKRDNAFKVLSKCEVLNDESYYCCFALMIGESSGCYFKKDTCLVIKKETLVCFPSLKSGED